MWLHVKCAKLNRNQLEAINNDTEFNWICEKCHAKTSQLSLDEKINIIFTKVGKIDSIREKIKDIESKVNKIDSIEETLEFLSDKHDIFEEKFKEADKHDKKMIKNVNSLTEEINHLKSAVKTLNDERIKNELVIRKVQLEFADQTAVDFVKGVISALRLEITDFKCNLSKNKSGGISIFVKFYHHEDKMKLVFVKKALKNMQKYKDLLIFDILGPETLELFNYAKLLKNHNYSAVFTVGSRVMAKFGDTGKPFSIKDKHQVDQLLTQQASWNGEISQRV